MMESCTLHHNYMSNSPLNLFQSIKVKNLLKKFYTKNFATAGVDLLLAEQIIEATWQSRNSISKTSYIDSCFRKAKKLANKTPQEIMTLDLLDLGGSEVFLDIGANKLKTINFLSDKYRNVKKFIAIDLIEQNGIFTHPQKCVYYKVNPDFSNFPVEPQSIDVVNMQFVLHHFKSIETIKKQLEICNTILKANGRLILWEETFEESVNVEKLINTAQKLGIGVDSELTRSFYELTQKQKWEFIIINDWIINTSNLHMPWTYQYYKWEEWVQLLSQYGFKLESQVNFGLRGCGNLKSGVHMMGSFCKV